MRNDMWSPIPRADVQHLFFTPGGGCQGSVTNGGGGGEKVECGKHAGEQVFRDYATCNSYCGLLIVCVCK